jgi:hypothetical protein
MIIASTTRVANLNVATAGTADQLTTTRQINGTNFNGSANITTANWGTARNITIGSTTRSVNGSTTYSWTLADIGAQAALTNPVTGTGVNGRVAFWTGTTTQSSDAALFWDNTNKRLGVGTASPARALHVSTASASIFTLERTSGTSSALLLEAGSNYTALYSRAANNNTAARELRFLIGNTQAAKITTSRDLEISEKLLFDTSSSSTGVLTLQGYHNSGAIVSINDSSGIPLMEFDSDKNIYANRFGGEFFLDGDVYQKDAPLYAFPPVAAITGSSFTLPYTGIGYYYRLTNSAGCTITVPNVTFPTGSEFYFRAAATGALSLVKGAGVSINNEALISGVGQHDNFVLKAIGSLEWDII